jgi:hypothetical protein
MCDLHNSLEIVTVLMAKTVSRLFAPGNVVESCVSLMAMFVSCVELNDSV